MRVAFQSRGHFEKEYMKSYYIGRQEGEVFRINRLAGKRNQGNERIGSKEGVCGLRTGTPGKNVKGRNLW